MADASAGGSERRKQLFVDKPLQSRMIGVLALFVVLPTVLFFLLVFLQGPHQGPEKVVYLLVNLVLVLILVLFGVVYVGLRFTNRIAGPIHHFGRQLTDIIKGDYTRILTFRKGDEFQNVAGAFNHAMGKLNERIKEDIDALDRMKSSLESMQTSEPDRKAALIAAIEDLKATKEKFVKGA